MSDTVDKVTPSAGSCLIVDDSGAFCIAVRRVLEAAGMTFIGTASTMRSAVAAAQASHPDLVLVDIDLGAESGFDVVEVLHAADLHPTPSIILVSTHDEDEFVDLIESSSAIGFLTKFELSAASIAKMVNSQSPGT